MRAPAPPAGATTRRRAGCPFFFRAQDGIRDGHVTGVQTCALPILVRCTGRTLARTGFCESTCARRSEERRVGKEYRAAGARHLCDITKARIGRGFQVVLDGMSGTIPVTKLAALSRLGVGQKI